jgi:hypothetical protein
MGGQRVTSGRCIAAVVMQLASAEEGRRAGSGRRSSGGSFRHDRVCRASSGGCFLFGLGGLV